MKARSSKDASDICHRDPNLNQMIPVDKGYHRDPNLNQMIPVDKGYLGPGTLCPAERTKDDRSDRVYS
jgi:hypothetical protein